MSDTTVTATRLPSSFTKKKIDVTFTVMRGSLGPDGVNDQVTLSGHRCIVDVTNAGMRYASALSLRIEGMTGAMMNRFSVMAAPINPKAQNTLEFSPNTVMVQAGDDETGMSTVFFGGISEAFADFSGSPHVAFQVVAYSNRKAAMTALESISYPGSVKVATIFSEIATKAGLGFINYGVTTTLNNHYGYGSAQQQIDRLASAAKCAHTIDGGGPNSVPVLKIWSENSGQNIVNDVPKISQKTGLTGYPSYSQSGVRFRSLFDPRIEFFQPVFLESKYQPEAWIDNQNQPVAKMPTDGTWLPTLVSHSLDSELPGGRWFTDVEAIRADLAGKVAPS